MAGNETERIQGLYRNTRTRDHFGSHPVLRHDGEPKMPDMSFVIEGDPQERAAQVRETRRIARLLRP